MTPWRDLILADDPAALAAAVRREIGLDVPPAPFRDACRAALAWSENNSGDPLGAGCTDTQWSEGSWYSWLRVRIMEVSPPRVGMQTTRETIVGVLHFGMMFIKESEEHIYNLKKEHSAPLIPALARSKLGRSILASIRPVDIVAHRVAPPPRITGGQE
jgi:hypothetical protein